jgi:polyisoprenyl-teichoic acid--peptidoglycan teichoic acid transferase
MTERGRGDRTPRGSGGKARSHLQRRRGSSMSFGRALGFTVLGTLLPGAGLIAASRRRLGALVLLVFGLAAAGAVYLVAGQRQAILHWAVQPEALNLISVVLPVVGLAWVGVIVGTYRSLRPSTATVPQRILGSVMIVALAVVVLSPFAIGGRYASVQRDVVRHIFASDDSESATRPKVVSKQDPWGGQERVNVLLLGGDGGKNRIGIRPDSLQVASIDTRTGKTVLLSLPRNLEKVPFPPGSVLADAYPNGTYDGAGDRLEWMINSIYENVPRQHPGLLDSDNPGADATKLAVGAALGLRLDYYVLINLEGFMELIDALGGITVNINERVAIGGPDEDDKPKRWLEVGPNRHLDGYDALWFSRGRHGYDDYHRMKRQRCTMKALIDQAEPGRVLTRYEAIAQSSKDIVSTDIPSSLLPAFVDLSMKVQRAGPVTSIAFTNEIIHSSDPDYTLIRSMAAEAIRSSEAQQDSGTEEAPTQGGTGPTSAEAGSTKSPGDTRSPSPTSSNPTSPSPTSSNPTSPSPTSPNPTSSNTTSPSPTSPSPTSSGAPSPTPSATGAPAPIGDSLDDACAYHPAVD